MAIILSWLGEAALSGVLGQGKRLPQCIAIVVNKICVRYLMLIGANSN
jgi:hypothetical protein